jgi:biotin carboxylase
VRRLAAAGYCVGGAARDGAASGMRTRRVAARFVVPDPALDLTAAADAIVEAVRATRAEVVTTTIDESLAALVARRQELERLTAPALGSPEALEIARSKTLTLEVARRLGIPVPRSLPLLEPGDMAEAVEELGLPAVLKPGASWRPLGCGGERVAPVYLVDEQAAAVAAERYVRSDAPALLQKVATGQRETVKLFRSGGNFVARLVMAVTRAWPPLGGSSVMRKTVAPPDDVLRHAERLVEEIALDGYSEVEFRRDADGRPLLMEVNPRLSQSAEVAFRAGVDFASLQLEWARGGPVQPVSRYAVGVRVGWLAGDLRLAVAALRGAGPPPVPPRGPTLRAIARDYTLGRARLEGLDLGDPAPVLGAIGFTLRSLGRT